MMSRGRQLPPPNQRVAPRKEDTAAVVTSDFVPVDVESLRYLSSYKQDELQRIQKDENVTITDGVIGYDVKGRELDVIWAARKMDYLVNEVKCSTFSFATGVDVREFTETAVTIGKKHGCIIGHKLSMKPGARQRAQSAIQFTQEDNEVKMTVVVNRIEKQKADVVVNTTNRQLSLGSGSGVSRSLMAMVGADVQGGLRHTYPDGIQYGDLAVTSSGNLDTCKRIYHGCLPFYTGSVETFILSECYECLVSLVFRILTQASKDGFQTIAMPAFGTGALQYPTKVVIQLMYHAIDLFAQDNRQTSLKEIFIVIALESRLDVKQGFLAQGITHKVKSRLLEAPEDRRGFFHRLFWPGVDDGLAEFLEREVRRPGQNECELRVMIGYTLVQIINGGINEVCNATQTGILLWRVKDKWNIVSPDLTSKAIVSALQSVSDVYVLTIAVPNTNCYIDLVTRIAQHGILQKPPDVTNSLADHLWKTKFARQRSNSLGMIHTPAVDMVMMVTSDSEETNRNAAKDVERELHVQMEDVMHSHTNLTRD